MKLNNSAALLLVGWGLSAAAQSFNLRIDPFVQAQQEGGWAVEVNADGNYLIIAGSPYQDSLFYSSVVTSILVDQQGNVLAVDRVIDPTHATYPGWSNSTAKRADGGFVTGGSNLTTDDLGNWIQHPVLYFLAQGGQPESFVDLGVQCPDCIGRQAKQALDGGYVICGETLVGGTQTDAFVIKTDAWGNEEWTRTYGGQWNDYFVSVDRSAGNGYFTGGQKRITSSNKEFWVQCLNDTGAVVWEKVWGGSFSESNANVTTAQNGDVLVAGGWAYSNFALVRRYLARLDPVDGSFIWQREYAAQTSDAALQVVKEVEPSMDLITVGSMAVGATYSGTLLRTTAAGDSLWMRTYQYTDSLVSNGSGILRDVEPTPDGGFIAVGSALQVGPYTQDVWVVKVDSMGCLEPGCNTIMGMETQITNLRGALTVAPNPVAQGGMVQVLLDLPENFTPQGALRITVVSSDGRLVHEQAVPPGTVPYSLSLGVGWGEGGMRSGLYHIHLSDATRWISGAKLIVE